MRSHVCASSVVGMDMDAPPPGRLFVVDDDAHVLAALKFTFEADGYEVVTLTSGEALIGKALPATGACIIIDYLLPGLSGLDTLARLRAAGETTPAILITTHPSRAVRKRAAEVAAEVIEKPLIGEALPRCIADLVAL